VDTSLKLKFGRIEQKDTELDTDSRSFTRMSKPNVACLRYAHESRIALDRCAIQILRDASNSETHTGQPFFRLRLHGVDRHP
jgi:hypothetical protein